jgi:GT2 family glycosyltransferase/glycosyltransferase involved in cell wall biosynthesis
MSKIVCILGMHRSGSSLLTRILNILGVYLGQSQALLDARPDNPTGFWELAEVNRINDELLSRFGGRWSDPPVFPHHWETSPILIDLKRQAHDLIANHFSGQELWGWKDPRCCLTLAFWRQVVAPTHYLLCVRNPADVASSLLAREGINRQNGANLWLKYVRSSLRETSGLPRRLTFYEDLTGDWRAEVRRLSEFIGSGLSTLTPEAESAIEQLVQRELRQHGTGSSDAVRDDLLEDDGSLFAARSFYVALRFIQTPTPEPETALQSRSSILLDSFADQCLAFQNRESALGLSFPAEDTIQLFWNSGRGLSEGNSISQVILPDGRWRRFRFDIPAGARGPLRLDPGSRLMYGEIQSAAVYTTAPGLPEPSDNSCGDYVAKWSVGNGFAGITASTDVLSIPGGGSYRFLTLGGDPRLFLSVALAPDAVGHHVLEITMRLFEDFRDAAVGEIVRLTEAAMESGRMAARELGMLKASEASLSRALLETKETGQGLQSSLTETQKQLQFLSDKLGLNEAELDHIKGTLGWRLLSAYGVIKHKLLIPAFRAVSSSPHSPDARIEPPAETVRDDAHSDSGLGTEAVAVASGHLDLRLGAVHLPGIRPLMQLRRAPDEEEWESTGVDPQFLVAPPYPTGWIKMVVHIKALSRPEDHAILFVDAGEGFTAEASYDLGTVNREQVRFFYFDRRIVSLRLDPLGGPDVFTVKTIEFHRVSAAEARKALRWELDTAYETGTFYGSAGPSALPPPSGFEVPTPIDPYDAWLEVNEWNDRRELVLRDRLAEIEEPPILSVVMPVYDPPPEVLNLAIQSVVDQVYDRWELCIADDGSRDQRIITLLRSWAQRDARIRVAFRDRNGGISAASNTAADLATGEYLLFMDNDDALSRDALGETALYLSEHQGTDVLYGDEDKIDGEGRRYDPGFKPDWSPELFLSYNYLNHPLIVKKSLFSQVGGFRAEMNFAQDWDLGLRATEAAGRIGHIPLVLYHWRAIPSSVAANGNSKPMGLIAARDAIDNALKRREVQAVVSQPDWAVAIACGYYTHRFPDYGPSVTVLIPTRNHVEILRACIDSLARTTYANYEVVIIDNGSDDPETLRYLAESPHRVLRIPDQDGKFSFADINNRAVALTSSDYVLFLNDDTEVVSPEWLSQMVGYLGIAGVGAVGARLLYPDGRVQHAGVIHWSGGTGPWHAFRFAPPWDSGFMGWSLVARNCSAVTAACMLTRRDLFSKLGGFDAKAFPVAYNDVDYCYRLLEAGRRVVYCPSAELIHHESLSRGPDGDPGELARCLIKYSAFEDRCYSPHLSNEGAVKMNPRTLAIRINRPVRTLMCAHNLNFEGAPLVQLEITLGLRDAGVIDPIVHSPWDGPLRAEYESRGIPVELRSHPLMDVHPTAEGHRLGMEAFTRWVQTLGVELVYGNTLRTFYAIEAATMAGLPSLWNPRESEDWQTYFDDFGPYIAARALECFAYPYKVIFVAKASMDRYADLCSRHNFINIHDGLDRATFTAGLRTIPRAEARRTLGIGEEEVVVVTVGTVCARKGQMDIPEAMAALDDETAGRLRWYIVGDRESLYSDALRARRDVLGGARASKLQIVPENPEVLKYYSAADVFVCTSRVESFPRVILEAMAAGLPIVTTPVFGIVEQVRPGRNALLYDPGDAGALARAVSRMVNEPALRQSFGAASQGALDSLIDHKSMVEAYATVFREAWLSGSPRGRPMTNRGEAAVRSVEMLRPSSATGD